MEPSNKSELNLNKQYHNNEEQDEAKFQNSD